MCKIITSLMCTGKVGIWSTYATHLPTLGVNLEKLTSLVKRNLNLN